MMKRKQMVVLAVVFVGSFFVFSFGHFSARALENFTQGDTYKAGTKIAGIEVGGKATREIEAELTNRINEWLGSEKLLVTYNGKSEDLFQDTFNFKLEDTITNVQQGVDNAIQVDIVEQKLKDVVGRVSNKTFMKHVDYEKLAQDVRTKVATFQGEGAFDLTAYTKMNSEEKKVVSNVAIKNPNYRDGMEKWVEKFPKIVVPANGSISLLKTIEDSEAYFSNDELSMVASSLYKTIATTNFEVFQRQISLNMPTYSEVGFEARINKEKKIDFIFFNPNSTPYELTFAHKDNTLEVKVIGAPFIYTYQALKEDVKIFQPKKVVQFNAALPNGVHQQLSNGTAGQAVTIVRVALDEEGNEVKRTTLGEDYYAPVPAKSVKSTREQTTVPPTTDNGNNSSSTDGNNNTSTEIGKGESEKDTNNDEGNSDNKDSVDGEKNGK